MSCHVYLLSINGNNNNIFCEGKTLTQCLKKANKLWRKKLYTKMFKQFQCDFSFNRVKFKITERVILKSFFNFVTYDHMTSDNMTKRQRIQTSMTREKLYKKCRLSKSKQSFNTIFSSNVMRGQLFGLTVKWCQIVATDVACAQLG